MIKIYIMWPTCPPAEFVGPTFNFRQRKENLPSFGHVLHKKSLNLVISRCCFVANGKENVS